MVKISELIEKLNQIKEMYGDIEMDYPCFDSFGGWDIEKPEQITVHLNEGINTFSISSYDNRVSDSDTRTLFDYMRDKAENKTAQSFEKGTALINTWGMNDSTVAFLMRDFEKEHTTIPTIGGIPYIDVSGGPNIRDNLKKETKNED